MQKYFGAWKIGFPLIFGLQPLIFTEVKLTLLCLWWKGANLFCSWSNLRATNRSVLTMAFRWLCQTIWVILICVKKLSCKKTFWVKSCFSQWYIFLHFVCFEQKTIGLFFLTKPSYPHCHGEQFCKWFSYAYFGYLWT